MRAFVDRTGTSWQVVPGRESWGSLVLLFVPPGDAPVRQAAFPGSGYDIALVVLDELSEERLQQLLDVSQPKTD